MPTFTEFVIYSAILSFVTQVIILYGIYKDDGQIILSDFAWSFLAWIPLFNVISFVAVVFFTIKEYSDKPLIQSKAKQQENQNASTIPQEVYEQMKDVYPQTQPKKTTRKKKQAVTTQKPSTLDML